MSTRTETVQTVSLTKLKEMAQRLPANSALKSLILSEPDNLPRTECLAKLDIFVKLLHRELKDIDRMARKEGRFLAADVSAWYGEISGTIEDIREELGVEPKPFIGPAPTVGMGELKGMAETLPENSLARMLILEKPDKVTKGELMILRRMVSREMAILDKMGLPAQVEDLRKVMRIVHSQFGLQLAAEE